MKTYLLVHPNGTHQTIEASSPSQAIDLALQDGWQPMEVLTMPELKQVSINK